MQDVTWLRGCESTGLQIIDLRHHVNFWNWILIVPYIIPPVIALTVWCNYAGVSYEYGKINLQSGLWAGGEDSGGVAGSVLVPPSAQAGSLRRRRTTVCSFFTQTSKQKESLCKTVQNQALFYFFFPASSPFAIIIITVITIIVVNIIFENISHRRQTAGKKRISNRLAARTSKKAGVSY